MKNIFLVIFFGFLSFGQLLAQSPFVGSISPNSGKAGDIVTITGRGFSATSSDLQVRFGGAVAEIVNSTETLIEVKVPNNAAFSNIFVTNLSTGLTVTSSEQFLYSFNGDEFDVDKLVDQEKFATGQKGVIDLCMCDFNNDSTLDIATTSTDGSVAFPVVTIFDNQSTPGNLSLNQIDLDFQDARYIICGDLNSDGLSELILAEADGINVFIFENTSTGTTISFDVSNPTTLSLPRQDNNDIRNAFQIEIGDFDNNGKIDILVGNSSDNTVHIFENNGSGSNISFSTSPVEIQVGESTTNGLDVQDLNNDGLPEIMVTDLEADAFIIPNISNENDIQFGTIQTLDFNSNIPEIGAADLNNDGFKDIILVDTEDPSSIKVFGNTTSGNGESITFDDGSELLTGASDLGASYAFGDLDGNGLVDIVITNRDNVTTNALSIFINNSSGSINLDTPELFDLEEFGRQIEIADIDGDSRPDLVFTHNSAANNFGDISVVLNQNCIRPIITPDNSQNICNDTELILETSFSEGTTYNWNFDIDDAGFTVVQSGTNHTINVNDYLSAGEIADITVTAISNSGTCTITSSEVTVRIDGTASTLPTPMYDGPICIGDPLTIDAGVAGAIAYNWTGPNGFSELTTSQVIEITDDFQLEDAGTYQVSYSTTSCTSAPVSILVEPLAFPFIKIDANDQTTFCLGTTKELSVTEYEGYDYKWTRDGSDLDNTNAASYPTTVGGTFTAVLIDGSGCTSESDPVELETIIPMQADFVYDELMCVDLPVSIKQSTNNNDERFTLNHDWDFGDGTTINDIDSTGHIYTSGNTYDITLTASYLEIPECIQTRVYPVVIREVPTYDIASDGTEKCPSDSLELSLADNFQSYLWSTGSTDFNAYANTEEGFNSVVVSVDWTDDAGCEGSSDITVNNFANSELTVSPVSSATPIVNDTVTVAPEAKSIQLSVSGGTDYSWTPIEVIENPNSSDVTIFPSQVYTTVTVTGTTAEVCEETETIVIIDDNVVARKTFSPNGDGLGFDCWEILNVVGLDCTVYIFDSKGTIIFEQSDFTDNCVWDGNANGVAVPDGVYYFVMKCNGTDSQFNRSGSILLAR